MKTPWWENTIDLTRKSVMLCKVCEDAIYCIRTNPPGTHQGSLPHLFCHARRKDVWTGSHHTYDDSLVFSVQNRCYICNPVLKGCPLETRKYASRFRTFFEIQNLGDGRYAMSIRIELEKPSPSQEAQVIELDGKFKILPKSGMLIAPGYHGN